MGAKKSKSAAAVDKEHKEIPGEQFEKDQVKVVMQAIEDIAKKDSKVKDASLHEYKLKEESKEHNQFIFFLKPEVTSNPGAKVEDIVKMALGKLVEAKVTIGGARVLSGDYLKEAKTMQEHYGVINKLSREGESAMTEAAKAKLQEFFGDDIKAGAQVVGAHQLLEKFSDLSPLALRVMSDSQGTKRLAGGTYAAKYTVLGEVFICVNPFHPFQLVPYTTTGNSIVVIEASSPTPWAELRAKVCGATDPAKAEDGSIRSELFKKYKDFGLNYVPSSSANGCHMSAGPLEALVELKRFFGAEVKSTNFGLMLSGKGVSDENITKMLGNPDLTFGDKTNNCFDATEELDAAAAAEKLASAK
eukprot:g69021.t1